MSLFRELLLALWNESACWDWPNKEKYAAWSGATKDLLFDLGLDWDAENQCYKLREIKDADAT